MIAMYKGLEQDVNGVLLKPGRKYVIKLGHKLFVKRSEVLICIDGLVSIPYTLDGLFRVWEPAEVW